MWTREMLKTNAKAALANKYWMAFLAALLASVLIGAAGATVIGGIFLSLPLLVGLYRFFMENRLGTPGIERMFSIFNKDYINVVLATFMKGLFVFLWSLLFIFPGIYKSYQYAMVDYILAENPGMDWQRALALSKQMTNGEKWNIFVLDLSFIGWFLLGALACGVGTLFVMPYYYATYAELYTALREKALSQGFASTDELPGFPAN